MTIEERANQYESAHKHRNIFIAYADGASVQKQIDIDKACEWLNNYLYCFQNDATDSIEMDALLSQFRKSMDE